MANAMRLFKTRFEARCASAVYAVSVIIAVSVDRISVYAACVSV